MTIRVVIEQPCLGPYRVPAFRALSGRAGLDLVLRYGRCRDGANAAPQGFKGEQGVSRQAMIGGRTLLWNASAWRSAGGGSDVLVLPWSLNHVNLVPALLRARAHGIGAILWEQGAREAELPLPKFLRDRVAGLATALLFSGDKGRARYRAAGFPEERLHLAPSALDQEPIRRARNSWIAAPEQLAAFRAGQGLDGPLILFVSRLRPEKRVDLLLEAVAMLRPTHPKLALAVIGPGEREQARLKARAGALGLDRRVRFLGPLYDQESLAPWFLSADAFCYPANPGLSLLHAFGFGLPVVTTDSRARQTPEAEALRSGENSLLYGHGDPAALAGVLHRLIQDPDLRAKLSRGALDTASRRTLKAMVDGLEGAIRYAAEAARSDPSAAHGRSARPHSDRAAGE